MHWFGVRVQSANSMYIGEYTESFWPVTSAVCLLRSGTCSFMQPIFATPLRHHTRLTSCQSALRQLLPRPARATAQGLLHGGVDSPILVPVDCSAYYYRPFKKNYSANVLNIHAVVTRAA